MPQMAAMAGAAVISERTMRQAYCSVKGLDETAAILNGLRAANNLVSAESGF